MNPLRILTAILCISVGSHAFAETQDIDKELSDLTERLAIPIKDHSKTKVAVIDFTDLDGNPSGELGRYIAEQVTVNLVMGKRDFSVLDRANLKKILAEHKLTSQGLVDPENAKKLGQFAGVDALILGTIIPKSTTSVSLTAKIITTDTAEIIGASRAEFKTDATVQALISKPAKTAPDDTARPLEDEKALVMKSFGDLRVKVQSLRIVNGDVYHLTFALTNLNPKRSIFIALNADEGRMGSPLTSSLVDPGGFEFQSDEGDLSGIAVGQMRRYGGYSGRSTEIKPSEEISVTINFFTRPSRAASPGSCRLELAFLSLISDAYGQISDAKVQNLLCQITAN